MQPNQTPTIQQDKVTRKVILLYICETLDNLTHQELMQTALESMYMDYFQFSTLLDELLAEKLVTGALRKGEDAKTAQGKAPERYSLTQSGLAVLDTLRKQIPLPVTSYLRKTLRDREQNLRDEKSVHADWQILPDGKFEVTLALYEKDQRYFQCQFSVPGEEAAVGLCQRWKNAAGSLYPQLLQLLYTTPSPAHQSPPAE